MRCFRIVILIFLLILCTIQFKESEGCKALTKPCFHNYDCCSHHCFKQLKWPTGLCKPGGAHHPPGHHNGKCKALGHHCKSNQDCCAKNCEKPGHHLNGVCKRGRSHPGGKNSGL